MDMQTGAGRRLAAVRQLAGLTQTKLGDILNVGQSTVAKWESGERMADPSRMAAVCARFKVSMDFLYRGRLEGLAHGLAVTLAQKHPDLVVIDPPDMG